MTDAAFAGAMERARLASADLVAAANRVIAWHTLRPEDVRDDVDAAVLSRRSTSYAPSRTLDEASDDLMFAGRARDELEAISASAASPVTGRDGVPTMATAVRRLVALAAECERLAASLRS